MFNAPVYTSSGFQGERIFGRLIYIRLISSAYDSLSTYSSSRSHHRYVACFHTFSVQVQVDMVMPVSFIIVIFSVEVIEKPQIPP